MSFVKDLSDARARFPEHVAAFERLFREHQVSSLAAFNRQLKNPTFRADFKALSLKIFEKDGGKISIPLLSVVVGAALGGVGIAMMGSAFGIPLALVGAIGGVFVGSEMDSTGLTKRAIDFAKRVGRR